MTSKLELLESSLAQHQLMVDVLRIEIEAEKKKLAKQEKGNDKL